MISCFLSLQLGTKIIGVICLVSFDRGRCHLFSTNESGMPHYTALCRWWCWLLIRFPRRKCLSRSKKPGVSSEDFKVCRLALLLQSKYGKIFNPISKNHDDLKIFCDQEVFQVFTKSDEFWILVYFPVQ